MLLLTKEHHVKTESGGALGSQSKFLTTTRLLQLFSSNVTSPTEDMRIIYIDGAWDMVRNVKSKAKLFRHVSNPFTDCLIVLSFTTVSSWSCIYSERSKGGKNC